LQSRITSWDTDFNATITNQTAAESLLEHWCIMQNHYRFVDLRYCRTIFWNVSWNWRIICVTDLSCVITSWIIYTAEYVACMLIYRLLQKHFFGSYSVLQNYLLEYYLVLQTLNATVQWRVVYFVVVHVGNWCVALNADILNVNYKVRNVGLVAERNVLIIKTDKTFVTDHSSFKHRKRLSEHFTMEWRHNHYTYCWGNVSAKNAHWFSCS